MPRYRLHSVTEGLSTIVYASVDTAKLAAQKLANALGEPVGVVSEPSPKNTYRRNPYNVRLGPYARAHDTFTTYEEAETVAKAARKQGLKAEIEPIGLGAKVKAASRGRAEKRVTVEAERRQAPANRKRTKGRGKSSPPPSKLNAIYGLFSRNPAGPAIGDYYFADPVTGGYVIGRSRAEIQRKAQARSNLAGRRVTVYYEDGSRWERPSPYKAKPRRGYR